MWRSESTLSILYRASSPPANKVKRAIEKMTPEEVAGLLETPIMLSPTMVEKIINYSHDQDKQFFEDLKQNTAKRLLNLIDYFTSTSFLYWDDYIVTYLTLINLRDDVLKLMESLPLDQQKIITENLRQHDAIYAMNELDHSTFIQNVQLLIGGDQSYAQTVIQANLEYQESSRIMMDIYKSVYAQMGKPRVE